MTVNGQVKTDPSKTNPVRDLSLNGTKLKCMGTVFQKRLKEIKKKLFKKRRQKVVSPNRLEATFKSKDDV